MPIYEYKCDNCGRISSVLERGYSAPRMVTCTSCGRTGLRKLVSRFAVVRSEESRLESLADPSAFAGVDENDPRSIARWARKMGKELGEDLGDDFDQMVERMEAGEMPEDPGGEEANDEALLD
ncbi:MAG: zinc ribbon domain-containing protein [Chloroflexi bacterium]|nr:zinc ribbon domain-containing protein [Chloroflexota bacterium]MDA8186953.1 hypothetical protein [Dehalococcoidales bacterium]